MNEFYSCGKLLITGEYLILRGARGLALPTSMGQGLDVTPSSRNGALSWRAFTSEGQLWLSSDLDLEEITGSDRLLDKESMRLRQILSQAKKQNPDFLSSNSGLKVETRLEFQRDWGLGSSSTLVHLIAQWAEVDPYELQMATFRGSGYDVMVADHACSIVFSKSEAGPRIDEVNYAPTYKDKLWFVHCGHKQDSASEVTRFEELKVSDREIDQISRITDELVQIDDLPGFIRLLQEHDFLLSRILARPSASEVYDDFKGFVKYLGAWGGDFMLATGDESDMDFFRKKGMSTILSYNDMIKQ